MADNFYKTAERMSDGCRVMHSSSLHHLTCYLSGYVVECYLKCLVQKTPSIFSSPRSFSHSVSSLNRDLQYAYSASALGPASMRPFVIDISRLCPKISSDWDPNKRYDDSSGWDASVSQLYVDEQEKCFDKVVEMYIANIIP